MLCVPFTQMKIKLGSLNKENENEVFMKKHVYNKMGVIELRGIRHVLLSVCIGILIHIYVYISLIIYRFVVD